MIPIAVAELNPVPAKADPVAGDDWMADLERDGFAVIKGAVPAERAAVYAEKAYDWLESLAMGFKRDDPRTGRNEHLPRHYNGGMYHFHRVGHEGFVWDVRGEEGVRAPFERLWKTKELLVSFDGATIAFPNWPDVPPLKPWPHVDQSPLKKGLQCLQGLVNLLPNYPDDGGLLVLKSSYKFNEEYFKHYGTVHNTSWRPEDWYGFTKEQLESFEKRGCEWEKVCAGPGDLLVWDSRTVHQNCLPKGERNRVVVYTCYGPRSAASEEQLAQKKTIFESRTMTTHWPSANFAHAAPPAEEERAWPATEPSSGWTDDFLRLAGAKAYE